MRGTGSEWPRGGERQRDNIVLWLLPPPSAPAQGCREGASTMRTQHHPCVQPRVSSWHHWHLWCPWPGFAVLQECSQCWGMLQDTPQGAPHHVMLGHTLTLEEAQHFLPPLPPWALVSPTSPSRTTHTRGTGSSGHQGTALEMLDEASVQLPAGAGCSQEHVLAAATPDVLPRCGAALPGTHHSSLVVCGLTPLQSNAGIPGLTWN